MNFRKQAIIRKPRFIPTTREEVSALGWEILDVILVTGDTYVDASHMGVAVIGRVLMDEGYRVGIIAQPDVQGGEDLLVMVMLLAPAPVIVHENVG